MNGDVILGLHGFSADSERQMHDAGVCILVDGVVVYGERYDWSSTGTVSPQNTELPGRGMAVEAGSTLTVTSVNYAGLALGYLVDA